LGSPGFFFVQGSNDLQKGLIIMYRRVLFGRLVAVLAIFTVIGSVGLVAPEVASARTKPATTKPANVWPMFHHDGLETGYSPDPLINDTVAPSMGVKWMSSLTTQALSSPVVAWNSTLAKTVAYAGGEAGYLTAFNQATGATIWSDNLGSAIRSTPAIDGTSIWAVPTFAPKLYKINAATGAIQCSATLTTTGDASPVVATPPGGTKTVYVGMNDLGTQAGPVYGINAKDCTVKFAFTGYAQESGIWAGISYATDKNGRGLVLFGSADPDAGVYAIDALTGALVWRFATPDPSGLADVGAGITVTEPGVNGFADGVAYVPSKDGYLFAFDLTTGTEMWAYPYYQYNGGTTVVGNGSRSTASIIGNQLVFGTSTGVFDVNAVTGSVIWQYPTQTEVLSSVAVVGPAGHRIVAFGDVSGRFGILSLATGQLLYQYQTHNYIAGSIADTDGNLLVTSADGFLYDFAPGGSNAPAPTTTVVSPASGATVANPNGNLTIQGTATDATGVSGVNVAVQIDGSTGPWWNQPTGSWSSGSINNRAVLASPGATSTAWSISVPMPARGTVVQVLSSAVNASGIADTTSDRTGGGPGRVSFTVSASTTAPTVFSSVTRIAPGGTATITGGGFTPGESVGLTLPTVPVTNLATVTAASDGTLPATAVTIPATLPFGPISLIATGATSGHTASAPLYISNNWDQLGNTPTKTGFEPNDTSLNGNVGANGKTYLDQAWAFPSGAAIHSSVSIDNGVAFFGNDAGDFYAINVVSGAPVWCHGPTPPTGSCKAPNFPSGIDSTAAIDNKLVIFGTEAAGSGGGSVVALNEATGATAWQLTTTAGVESSPAVFGGVVYVGADDGTVYAINESTGAVIWTQTLAGPVHSSPAVVSARGVLVVGDNSGYITALQLSNGALAWHVLTGGAVTATPLYFSNNIYVGSTDGKEYALVAKTGLPVWTYTTGGAITASNVTFGTSIGVGSTDANVYYLDSKSGAVVNELVGAKYGGQGANGPIVGMSGSLNFMVAETSNGTGLASRVSGTDQTWKWTSSAGMTSTPTILNGVVYITGLDMALHAFTAPGRPVY
jgi:outer membrane protein assembly factor BamB